MPETKPRVLIISHTSFTKSDSMGGTLASYFSEYPAEYISQFYIKDMKPDIPVCRNYYCVTDRELLRKLCMPWTAAIGKVLKYDERTIQAETGVGAKSSALGGKKHRDAAMILRHLLWKTNVWRNHRFKQWLLETDPQVVLVQPGDFPFIMDLAVDISKKLQIPLVLHQSEAYYLKKFEKPTFAKRVFVHIFRKSYERMMDRVSHSVYLCEALTRDYQTYFSSPASTIMKATDMVPVKSSRVFHPDDVRFVYGGNLSETVGRHEPLLQMGRAVQKIGFCIDVYTMTTGSHLKNFTSENGIRLHDGVSRDELQAIMQDSDFVIHVENQSEWHKQDLKYAMSTKIADMLASGCCSLIFGSEEIASIRYFKENKLGCVLEDPNLLETQIQQLIDHSQKREQYIENALKQVKEFHNPKDNSIRMMEIIQNVWDDAKLQSR